MIHITSRINHHKSILLVLVLTGLTVGINYVQAQNQDDFFKVPTVAEEKQPLWVQKMYSANPNVYEVDYWYSQYYAMHSFEKTIHTQNYKYWRRYIAPFLTKDGYIRMPTEKERSAKKKWYKSKHIEQGASKGATNWTLVGPIETYKLNTMPLKAVSRQACIFALDQSNSTPDILYAGTQSGGIFKTIDRGINWALVTKNEPFVDHISAVKIHPTNPDIVYVSVDKSTSSIYQTNDGGNTWGQIFQTAGEGYEIKIDPTRPDTLYFANSKGLYRSNNGGILWDTLFSESTWDIDFHPINSDTLYILKEDITMKRAVVFRSDNAGLSWILKDSAWYVPDSLANATILGGKLAIPPSAPDMIYAALIGNSKGTSFDKNWIGVYKSNDKGDSWINPDGQDGGPYGPLNGTAPWNLVTTNGGTTGSHQGFYNFDLEVSSSNPGRIWVGAIHFSESIDSGKTFIRLSGSSRYSDPHSDIQDIEVNGNEIWIASDGGINYSTNEIQTHESRKKGISASEYWGFNGGWNEDVLVGGRYHNFTSAYFQTYGGGNFQDLERGREECTGYVHPIENKRIYSARAQPVNSKVAQLYIPDVLGGNNMDLLDILIRPNEGQNNILYQSGIYFNPLYANQIYLGRDSILWMSRDEGANFYPLKTFIGGMVLEIEIARDNPDVMYCVHQKQHPTPANQFWSDCNIYKSIDGGANWTKLSNPPSDSFRFQITVNPSDADDLWVAIGKHGNATVAKSVFRYDSGTDTWSDLTTPSLTNESIRDIHYQGGSNDVVYLATARSVYYWNSASNTWIDFGSGLPMVAHSLKFAPFYKEAKIRLASRGRGIWERDFADVNFLPLAQPITYTDTILCPYDTVQFDCYSMLRHSSASWQWTITPSPQYISSTTTRNPKVVFGNTGSFTVSLQVTDDLGNSSTKTVDSMITVVETTCAMLPIELFKFKTKLLSDKNVQLSWSIFEDNLAYYEIEHSLEGISFNSIAKTMASLNQLETKNYTLIHTDPKAGFYNYYRLKIVDLEDNISYSEVRAIFIPSVTNRISIYPNPVTSNSTVFINLSTNIRGRLRLFTIDGKRVRDVFLEQAKNEVAVDGLNSGTYFYSIETEQQIKNGILQITK